MPADLPAIPALLASEPAKAPFVSRNEEWGLRPDFTTAGVTAPPDGAEVREAAEALRSHIDSVWAITPEEFDSAGQPGVAKTIRLARRLLAAIRANASPAPGSEEAREAEDELQRIDNILARRITLDGLTRVQKIALALRVCVETDPKGEVAARCALRGGQKGVG